MFRRLFNKTPKSKGASTATSVAQIYRPIIRGYFGVAAAYYIIMTPTHYDWFGGSELLAMAGASVAASIFLAIAWFVLRKPIAIGKLELITSTANLLVLTNVMVAMHLGYADSKLMYFIMMAMIFAFASVSMRQAVVSIAAVLGGLFYQLFKNSPEQFDIYGFIAFASAITALAITFFLRRAIGLAVVAKHEAEEELHNAQSVGETMRQRSLSDSLTGLPNRRAFFETLTRCKDRLDKIDGAWLILLDLDGFKAVNDVHGHIIGDELLKAVSSRMAEYCDIDAHVSRMGGDEFNIILSKFADEESVEHWCENLLEKIAKVYLIEERLVQISGSIGCHKVSLEKTDTHLINNADYALLHAKKHGKNRVVVFRDEHAKDAAERFKIEQALRVADFGSELELVFQPQVDLGLNQIVSAEALARWNSPILGEIAPDRFIKIAEESGLIANITLVVLEKALAALKSWENNIPLSVNLSGHDLISDQVINQIISQVQESGVSPGLLEFEVTETAMLVDVETASANLLRLSGLGHPLALDDFGTGYCNFNYLRTLPINKLKIDRSFVENLADPMTDKILHSLAGMARILGVDCLLEGIEDELQLVMAKRVQAQLVQGYLFGRPMNESGFLASIEEQWFEEIVEGSAKAATGK